MTRILLVFITVLLTAATCSFEPEPGAPGVALTQADGAYHLTADPALRVALLALPGGGLTTDHPACEERADAIECTLRDVETATIEVDGTVEFPPDAPRPHVYGVVCRDECHSIGLSE